MTFQGHPKSNVMVTSTLIYDFLLVFKRNIRQSNIFEGGIEEYFFWVLIVDCISEILIVIYCMQNCNYTNKNFSVKNQNSVHLNYT